MKLSEKEIRSVSIKKTFLKILIDNKVIENEFNDNFSNYINSLIEADIKKRKLGE